MKERYARRRPYGEWLANNVVTLKAIAAALPPVPAPAPAASPSAAASNGASNGHKEGSALATAAAAAAVPGATAGPTEVVGGLQSILKPLKAFGCAAAALAWHGGAGRQQGRADGRGTGGGAVRRAAVPGMHACMWGAPQAPRDVAWGWHQPGELRGGRLS
jgi:hypothetical protein